MPSPNQINITVSDAAIDKLEMLLRKHKPRNQRLARSTMVADLVETYLECYSELLDIREEYHRRHVDSIKVKQSKGELS